MAVFVQVAENGSFTAAAKVLGLPKSTVSQRVAELEDALGVRLMLRTTRRLTLTHAGQLYLQHCQRMVDAARAANAAISQLRVAPAGRIRLTVPEASGIRLFPAMIQAFHTRYPQIEVDCLVTDNIVNLVEEGIDIAFRTGKQADSTFVSRRVGPVRRVLVASPTYLEQSGLPDTLDELSRHAGLLHYAVPAWPLYSNDEVKTVELKAVLRSNSLLHLLETAKADLGIALLPYFLCQHELASGQLLLLLPNHPPTRNDYYMVTAGRHNQPAALLAFMQFIEEYGLARQLEGSME
ncbi:LysR family transcriptional regulator [Chitinivorax sp. B]|uniref:LysR family transcriptional regulator n=1 Tax=Chitinivorax sp. B TaxID=2502235 RepID=UPI0020174456|nr:LysR family transcriptional regulator [Chitinivorax sp. B]